MHDDEGRSDPTRTARPIDPAGLTGAWVNTEAAPRGVAHVVVESRSEALGLWALGADDQTHEGWGWTDAEALYAASPSGDAAVAFTAAYLRDAMRVELHANVSKGLLIVSTFQTRSDSLNAHARFAREFFRRVSPARLKPLREPGKQPAARPVTATSSPSHFLGTWRNTNSEACSIASVAFAASDGGLTMRVQGADGSDPRDWGTTAVEIYTEEGTASEPAKIKARYDLGPIDVLLHGWVKQGVLVFALFRRFTDGSGRSNYFDREFFYRMDEGDA